MVTVVTAYPVGGKKKSMDICLAFVRSCGGQVAGGLRDGISFFYGVDQSNLDIWRKVRAQREFLYCDNAYFDSSRQAQFRITHNRLQHTGFGTSDGKRFEALGIEIKPWQTGGEHIVVCPQSDQFMRDLAEYSGNWSEDVVSELKQLTQRPVRVRAWNRDKGALAATLHEDLAGAHCLVTWSSAAAISAILAGVPAIVLAPDCAARPMAGTSLTQIGSPPRPDGRETWAGVLADNQWTLSEIADGTAWKGLQR